MEMENNLKCMQLVATLSEILWNTIDEIDLNQLDKINLSINTISLLCTGVIDTIAGVIKSVSDQDKIDMSQLKSSLSHEFIERFNSCLKEVFFPNRFLDKTEM